MFYLFFFKKNIQFLSLILVAFLASSSSALPRPQQQQQQQPLPRSAKSIDVEGTRFTNQAPDAFGNYQFQ